MGIKKGWNNGRCMPKVDLPNASALKKVPLVTRSPKSYRDVLPKLLQGNIWVVHPVYGKGFFVQSEVKQRASLLLREQTGNPFFFEFYPLSISLAPSAEH